MSYRCAACNYFGRKCQENCIFAAYFTPDEQEKFDLFHKHFGGRNIAKVLQVAEHSQRATTITSMYSEAQARIADPVHGCTKIINELKKQICDTQAEVEKRHAAIAFGNQPQQPSNASSSSKNNS